MEFYSAVLFYRRLSPVLGVRNYSTLLEFWQVVFALPSSCICPSYSVLCSSRPSRPPSQNYLKIADLAMTGEQASGVKQFHRTNISDSLYHCTILLFFTLHCIFGFCVSKSAVVCHQSFLGQCSATLHNINLGI